MRTFSTADLNKHVGDVTDAARRGPVFITHHRKPRYVLMAIEDFERMRGKTDRRKQFTLDTMPAEIEEGLLALADSYEKDGGAND
nr:type II toxin-antitoxin system Phd/YefM family antitoxin [Nitratireductor luteus]